jgi:hypothetical protein
VKKEWKSDNSAQRAKRIVRELKLELVRIEQQFSFSSAIQVDSAPTDNHRE